MPHNKSSRSSFSHAVVPDPVAVAGDQVAILVELQGEHRHSKQIAICPGPGFLFVDLTVIVFVFPCDLRVELILLGNIVLHFVLNNADALHEAESAPALASHVDQGGSDMRLGGVLAPC